MFGLHQEDLLLIRIYVMILIIFHLDIPYSKEMKVNIIWEGVLSSLQKHMAYACVDLRYSSALCLDGKISFLVLKKVRGDLFVCIYFSLYYVIWSFFPKEIVPL